MVGDTPRLRVQLWEASAQCSSPSANSAMPCPTSSPSRPRRGGCDRVTLECKPSVKMHGTHAVWVGGIPRAAVSCCAEPRGPSGLPPLQCAGLREAPWQSNPIAVGFCSMSTSDAERSHKHHLAGSTMGAPFSMPPSTWALSFERAARQLRDLSPLCYQAHVSQLESLSSRGLGNISLTHMPADDGPATSLGRNQRHPKMTTCWSLHGSSALKCPG